jgi:hypothetical protein
MCINSSISRYIANISNLQGHSEQRNMDCLCGLSICQMYEPTNTINASRYETFMFLQYSDPCIHMKYC